ncbi:MAG: RNA polymerase sigma-70 factor [Ignavibacteriaceae bacterium]
MSKNNKTTDSIDNRILQSIKLDDKLSFERVYKQYWSKLYIYAFNVLKEREICEDIVQEIFIDLWTKRHAIKITDLNSYLYQSVKYQIFNCFRKNKYKKLLLMKFDLFVEQYAIDELYEQKELKEEINDIISKLPEQRRRIFQMSRRDGLSNKEISDNLNVSVQTVRNQISTSLKFIRKSLKNIYMILF